MESQALSFDLSSPTLHALQLPALDSARTLVLAFGAPELIDNPTLIEALAKRYPRSLLVGCSSAGEIHGTTVRDHSLSVTVTRFDKTDLQLASLEVASATESFAAGAHLAKRLAAKPGLRGVLVLSEGLAVNGSELIRGLNSVLDESIVVTGGLSGDGANFKRTWVAVGAKVRSNVVAAVGFYGDHVVIGHGSKGGWDKFGPERVVTRSEGNVLYELDGKPALQLYKQYLGDKAKELPASGLLFPLSLRASTSDDKYIVRTLLSVDHAASSLTFAGDIPRGHHAQLMKADFDRLIDGAGHAATMTNETAAVPANGHSLVVAISCVGRRLVLGDRIEEEVEAVRDAVRSPEATITGFYSYGEISPYATGHCDLHNQTMTLTVFSESPTPIERVARGSRPAFDAPSPSLDAGGFAVMASSYDHDARTWSHPLPPLDSPRTLVLGFGAPELAEDPAVFEELARRYPRSIVLGCSSAGEIHGTSVRDRSLAVTVTRFGKTDLQLASLEVASAGDSFVAGSQLAKRLSGRMGLRGVLVLSEGLAVNGSELIRGLNSVLDDSVVVTGGLSGDGASFKRTWVAVGSKVRSNVVAAVGFYGDHVTIGHGSKGGWDKFGPERTVTRSEGNVLFELDGKPALQLYKEYLGDKAKDLPASGLRFPLALRAKSKDDKYVVRTLLSVDHAANSLTFAGDIPRGYSAQLMKADFDRLIDGAGDAGTMTVETGAPPANTASLVVAISCVGRRLVLGDRVEEEVEAVRDGVGSPRATITGFYSYGEISPYGKGHCDLHNQTMTLTVFSESETPLVRAPGRMRAPDAVHRARAAALPPAPEPSRRITLSPMPAVAPPIDLAPPPPPSLPVAPTQTITAVSAPAPHSPIVRLPRTSTGDATAELGQHGELQLVQIRGRITESFKGEPLGRQLAGRVVFDLAEVDRVTSFGVREWLAMLSAGTKVREIHLARCSESIVNQLTMIRDFAGGAKVVSFFAPYLCNGCGVPVERLLDCERDVGELATSAPAGVKCPRCDAEAHFDDEPRSYFGFAAPAFGAPLPADVRALHDQLAAQVAAPLTDEVDKTVDEGGTRIRVQGKLLGHVRWSRILDGIEGKLVVDLAAIPNSDAAGINNLEQALRALPPEVKPIEVEAAPGTLIERILKGGNRRVRIVSAVVMGYCDACAVSRPAIVRIDQYANDLAGGVPHQVLCKRCNGPLALTVDDAFQKVVEIHQRPARAPAAPSVDAPSRTRGTSWVATGLVAIGACALGVLGVLLYTQRATEPASADPGLARTPAPAAVLAAAATPPPAPPPAPPPSPPVNTWQDPADLPPAWVERPLVVETEAVYVVGHSTAATNSDALIEAARTDATMRLLEHVLDDPAAARVRAFVQKRAKLDSKGTAALVAARFERQYGKTVGFERVDVARRKRDDGIEVYIRYKLTRQGYTQLVSEYRETARFRGLEVARLFPFLESTLHTQGELIVLDVDRQSAAEAAGLRAGDVIMDVAGTPVSTAAAFRTAALERWSLVPPRQALVLQVESAGAVRAVAFVKPAPLP